MAVFITGVAGFIGSNLAQKLIAEGQRVFGIDNFCRGRRKNLEGLEGDERFRCVEGELTNLSEFRAIVEAFHKEEPIEEVWHMAANSDIPAGVADANVDLNDTFITTFNTLQVMEALKVRIIYFASSSAVYGNWGTETLTENFGPLMPISNYGAMKLASEAAISAAAESFLEQAYIHRFPNVIGVPATHGVILDFIHKLKQTPDVLSVLGNGSQQKSYLHVDELIDAMLFVREHSEEKRALYNIGPDDDGVTVRFIAEETVRQVSPDARIAYGSEDRGWVGDVPRFSYSTDKLKGLGWVPRLDSRSAIKMAVQQILEQEASA